MIVIPNLKLAPGADEAALKALAAKALKIPAGDITGLRIRKKSLDARKKDDIHYVYTIGVTVRGDERKLVRRCRGAAIVQDKTYPIPRIAPPQTRPVIVGFGPAGMFAALLLARAGANPIVLERGPDAQTRSAQIAAFRAGGAFDPECNVQFGEGGAGTFSDGKLNTGTHDARIGFVLAEFAAHGAPEHITYDAKPHIGTDVLVEVVQSLRREVIVRGGEVRFGHRMAGLSTQSGHITVLTVRSPEGEYTLPAQQVILAIGHSARAIPNSCTRRACRWSRSRFPWVCASSTGSQTSTPRSMARRQIVCPRRTIVSPATCRTDRAHTRSVCVRAVRCSPPRRNRAACAPTA